MKKRLTTLLLAGIAGSAMVMGASAADITADEILKNAGRIEHQGSTKAGKWVVLNHTRTNK